MKNLRKYSYRLALIKLHGENTVYKFSLDLVCVVFTSKISRSHSRSHDIANDFFKIIVSMNTNLFTITY
jgi:hypothetical protein